MADTPTRVEIVLAWFAWAVTMHPQVAILRHSRYESLRRLRGARRG